MLRVGVNGEVKRESPQLRNKFFVGREEKVSEWGNSRAKQKPCHYRNVRCSAKRFHLKQQRGIVCEFQHVCYQLKLLSLSSR